MLRRFTIGQSQSPGRTCGHNRPYLVCRSIVWLNPWLLVGVEDVAGQPATFGRVTAQKRVVGDCDVGSLISDQSVAPGRRTATTFETSVIVGAVTKRLVLGLAAPAQRHHVFRFDRPGRACQARDGLYNQRSIFAFFNCWCVGHDVPCFQ